MAIGSGLDQIGAAADGFLGGRPAHGDDGDERNSDQQRDEARSSRLRRAVTGASVSREPQLSAC
jgi:hypothetical protein